MFVPIKGNQLLLFALYSDEGITFPSDYLHLSIYEIRSDNRVGLALWSFNGSIDGHFDTDGLILELIKSTENALGITVVARFDNHWKLFDISTTETDSSDTFPLIKSGRIDFDKSDDDILGLSFSFSCVEPALMCSPSHTIA